MLQNSLADSQTDKEGDHSGYSARERGRAGGRVAQVVSTQTNLTIFFIFKYFQHEILSSNIFIIKYFHHETDLPDYSADSRDVETVLDTAILQPSEQ